MKLNSEQKIMLEGGKGPTKQKAMRLLIDLGRAANAEKLVPVVSAHVSGVSPLTGGDGLIKFLKDLGGEDDEQHVTVQRKALVYARVRVYLVWFRFPME